MLTFLLALVVGLGSLALYLSAFFVPEVYRKGDLVWAGVGLFYALVLWLCGDRITGGVLLGQIASVSLIGWFGYQAISARLEKAPDAQAKVDNALNSETTQRVLTQGKQLFSNVRGRVQTLANRSAPTESTASEPYQPLTREDFGNPPVTVETQSTEAAKSDVMGTIGGVGAAIGGIFKKQPKNTSTYVRKAYRDDESVQTDDGIGYEEDIIESEEAVEIASVVTDQDGASESTIDADAIVQEEIAYEAAHSEEHPQAVPPHPPSPELVEAAIEDAEEKHIPANPPEPAEET